ncbi:unnamed protein product [Dimorphilus gyrociliatus]|uniref:F-box domain-containing protein n=1 Tax=Dimorphilus gyrociliatus TaxID=2664684 RepID=A0A7I8V6X7_9ANNE|nr:unnamed protein product [Dimorphilus gyrociliatus]
MAHHDELESFRREWKKELQSVSTIIPRNEPQQTNYKSFNIADELLQGNDLDAPKLLNIQKRKLEIDNPEQKKKKALVDILIEDLNEGGIPIFDISLPKEVALCIFSFLSMKDLCNCAMVSREWNSLASDDVIWHKVFINEGLNENIFSELSWKKQVQAVFERRTQLSNNWRMRTAHLTRLEHARGGKLLCCNSSSKYVCAGYSNNSIKLWNIPNLEEVVLQPSENSLILLDDDGRVSNVPMCVETAEEYTAAGFLRGNVDIWKNDANGTMAFKSFNTNSTLKKIKFSEDYLACTSMDKIYFHNFHDNDQHLTLEKKISDILFYKSNLFVLNLINEIHLQDATGKDKFSVLDLPHESYAEKFEVRRDNRLALALFISFSGQPYRLILHDMETWKEVTSLYGHSSRITCLHSADTNYISSGSVDKLVRIFDDRCPLGPTSVLQGHVGEITSVQMDDYKLVSASVGGDLFVWDRRTNKKLWEFFIRHPVRHVRFTDRYLVCADIPRNSVTSDDEIEHLRNRGSISLMDFESNADNVLDICQSSYDEPIGYNYNIRLALPYDNIS